MYRSLMGRENGENEFLFHAPVVVRSILSSRLHRNKTKTFDLGDSEYYYCLDIEKEHGQYLLVAGQDKIKVYDILETEKKPQQVASTAADPANNTSRPVRSALWYPQDPGIFLIGDSRGEVVIWDTNEMTPASTLNCLGEEEELNALSMSRVPSAHSNLVAVASSRTSLNLLDLSSGAFVHTLSGHTARILDAVWSPCAPYLILTASSDCTSRLFDIRRGGRSSCLATLDANRRMPGRERSVLNRNEPLGLGMIWNQPTLGASRKRMRRARLTENLERVCSHVSPVLQCRFTSDGRRLLTRALDTSIFLWDAFSGHWINGTRFGGLGNSDGYFEVGLDPATMYVVQSGAVAPHDLDTFEELSRSRRQLGGIQKMCAHPHLMDICVISNYREVVWMSPKWIEDTKKPRDRHGKIRGLDSEKLADEEDLERLEQEQELNDDFQYDDG